MWTPAASERMLPRIAFWPLVTGVFVDRREEVLVVPRQAVFEREGKKVVYRGDGSRFRPVEVELGPLGLGRVVIDGGLDEGDRIALRDPTVQLGEPGSDDDGEGSNGPIHAGAGIGS